MRRLAALVLLVFLVGCDAYGDESSHLPAGSPTFDTATAYIETEDDTALFNVEVADTPEERAYGLMNRKSLPEDSGMLFVFFEPSSGGFWMKDTLVPLSIAFFDHDGKITAIYDMDPCTKEPCRSYRPRKPYWGALEVNQGVFEEHGIEVGDTVRTNQ